MILSGLPYNLRVYQDKIHPRLTSWALWALIGLVLLITYSGSGAKFNIWPAIFGFTNPTITAILIVVRQRGRLKKPDRTEIVCLVIGIISLLMWLGMRQSRDLVQYALYVAIIADGCAAIPTIRAGFNHPDEDRPFAWSLFAVAYAIALFAITDYTLSNYALPIYMFLAASGIALPLAMWRIKRRVPLKEWI